MLTLVSAVYASIDADGSGASPGQVYTLALWCDSCSCLYVGPLCKHLVGGRILHIVRGESPSWHGSAESLYWGAGPMPSYAVRCCTAPVTTADSSNDDETEARAAEDLPSLFATIGHHLALFAGRAGTGIYDGVQPSEVARALRGLAGRAVTWSGARIVEPGAPARRGGVMGRFQPRVGSFAEVDADRATGPQLREPLRAADWLELLATRHPLPQSDMMAAVPAISASGEGGAPAGGVAAVASDNAPRRAWAATVALNNAASLLATATRARALPSAAVGLAPAVEGDADVMDWGSATADEVDASDTDRRNEAVCDPAIECGGTAFAGAAGGGKRKRAP